MTQTSSRLGVSHRIPKSPPAKQEPRPRSPRLRRNARLNGLLFTLPVMILLALVIGLPLMQGLYYSFTNWDGASASWIGLQNYTQIFRDPNLQRTLLNNALILASVPVGMIFPFVTAYLLSNGLPGGRFLRILIFAPTALSWVVVGLVAKSFFASNGLINQILTALGMNASRVPNWLADPTVAIVVVIVVFNAAVFGVNTIIFLAGFATLDRSILEAAKIDGASPVRTLVSIILPSMRRFVEFVFIITLVVSFTGLFALIFVMTGGGPGYATTTLEFAIWQSAFANGDFGQGAALGIALMVVTLVLVAVGHLVSRERKES